SGSGNWSLFGNYRALFGLVVVPLLLVIGPLLGWGKSALKERYDSVRVGMDAEEALEILMPAQPTRRFGLSSRSMSWVFLPNGEQLLTLEESGAKVQIYFYKGRVVRKKAEGLD